MNRCQHCGYTSIKMHVDRVVHRMYVDHRSNAIFCYIDISSRVSNFPRSFERSKTSWRKHESRRCSKLLFESYFQSYHNASARRVSGWTYRILIFSLLIILSYVCRYTISTAFSRCQLELRVASVLQEQLGDHPYLFILAIMFLGLFLSM